MRRIPWYYLLLMLLFASRPSFAIQLHWSSGATTLSYTSATRCTLVVQAEPAEVRLPAEWRLLWVSDSLPVQFVVVDSLDACLDENAQVFRIEGPATAAEIVANQVTERFCSTGSDPAATAQHILDLPASGHGKLKIIALDPSDPDSATVLESNEVTYNGGTEGSYPPAILHASSVHQSLQLEVTAVGGGLGDVSSMRIGALDASWTLPLTVTARSDASLTGTASVAALVPACNASVGSESGAVSAATLAADEEPAPLSPESCTLTFAENLLPPPPPTQVPHHDVAIQPKDLAWARGFVDPSSNRYALHLFYIRHSFYNIAADDNEKNIGHAWTTDLNIWQPAEPDTDALTTVGRTGKFDELHVWAPSIVQLGPVFHMFYTGVKNDGGRRNQRIGVATSTDLITWSQENAPVLTSPQVPWAKKDPPPVYGGQQLRDPFVMRDPINPGQWLMYYVALDSLTNLMAVGAARSPDLRNWAAFEKPFSSTERPTSLGVPTSVESPHVFQRKGNWWMPYTVNGEKVVFETSASSDPADTVAAHWSNPVSLFDVVEGPLPELRWWHSTEYLKVQPGVEYLAAWRDSTEGNVDIKGIYPTGVPTDSFALSCPAVAGIADGAGRPKSARMSISSRVWGAPEVRVRLELPGPMSMRLAVHDIAGRRRTTLLDDEDLPSGATEVVWDGRDDRGQRLASGMYFVRLTHASGMRVAKIVILR